MIVECIAVENWRLFRGIRNFSFSDGINIISGPNEAGKSTLLEALAAAFFYRHTGATATLRSIVPAGTELPPSVDVIFRTGGRRYRLKKRFFSSPESRLFKEEGGHFIPEAEGSKADELIIGMVTGSSRRRGKGGTENRGIAQALWYFQRDEHLPEEGWNRDLIRTADGLSSRLARTPFDIRFEKLLMEEYSRFFTPTGREALHTELEEARDRLKGLMEDLRRVEEDENAIENFRKELAGFEESREKLRSDLSLAVMRRDDLHSKIERSADMERKRQEKRTELEETRRRLNGLKEVQERIAHLNSIISQLKGTWKEKVSDRGRAEMEVERSNTEAEILRAELHRIECELESSDRELDIISRNIKRYQIMKNMEDISHSVQRYEERLSKLQNMEGEMNAMNIPSAEVWSTMQMNEKELERLEHGILSNTVVVRFELREGVSVVPWKHIRMEAGSYEIAEETLFSIEGVGTVRIIPPSGLAEMLVRKNEIEGWMQSRLSEFGASDFSEIKMRWERHEELEREISSLRNLIREEEAAHSERKKRLSEFERELDACADSEAYSASVADFYARQKEESDRREELRRRMKDISSKLDEKEVELSRLRSNLSEIENNVSIIERDIEVYREQRQELLINAGSEENLAAEVTAVEGRLNRVEREYTEVNDEYMREVELPRANYADAEQQVRTLQRRLEDIERQIVRCNISIENIASTKHLCERNEISYERDYWKGKVEELERRAEAVRLLHDLFYRSERERINPVRERIAEKVSSWFKTVTQGAYSAVELDEELLPRSAVRDGSVGMPPELLSAGTYEQLVVLLRLALASVFAEEEKALVILDDRLTNSDAVRSERMCEVLVEVAQNCQLILATFDILPYMRLLDEGANLIEI